MFEEVDKQEEQNSQDNNSQVGEEAKKEMSSSLTTEEQSSSSSKVNSEEKKEEQPQKETSSGEEGPKKSGKIPEGGNVEDIFEGVDTGQPPQKKEPVPTATDSKIPSSRPSFLNKGMLKFLAFVTLAAAIILGGAYWVSEWMVSSL